MGMLGVCLQTTATHRRQIDKTYLPVICIGFLGSDEQYEQPMMDSIPGERSGSRGLAYRRRAVRIGQPWEVVKLCRDFLVIIHKIAKRMLTPRKKIRYSV